MLKAIIMRIRSTILCESIRMPQQRTFVSATFVEQWIDVPNCCNYRISSLGNVYNKKYSRLLTVNYERFKKNNRRAIVQLTTDQGKQQYFLISRLILLSFNPHPNSDALQANHIDGNCYNDILENLNWMTPSQNMKHSYTLSTRKRAEIPVELTRANGDVLHFPSVGKCGLFMSLTTSSRVSELCTKQQFYHGYQFKYSDPRKYDTCVTNLHNEQWKQCGIGVMQQTYFISDHGRVKVGYKINGKEKLIQTRNAGNYNYVNAPKSSTVHRLVATHFVPNPNNYNIVDHIDGNSLNNNASNLRWVKSHSDNMNNEHTKYRQLMAHRRRSQKQFFPIFQLDKYSCKVLNIWHCPSQLKALGYRLSFILRTCREKRRVLTAYGYIWTFKGDQNCAKSVCSRSKQVQQLNKTDPSVVIKQWTFKELTNMGYHASNIGNCCAGRIKSAHGYKWKYVDR
eukprot:60862_1